MLSAAVAGLVSKYLGDYVEIAPDQLSVGLMDGELNVENLRFRAEALRDLNLPVTVKEGVVGRLRVQVPWTSLWSSPTRVVVEDIYLVAEHKEAVFDKDYDTRAETTKERLLQLREMFLAGPPVDNEVEAVKRRESVAAGPTWASRLIAGLANGVQVTVNRVHIRFEGAGFACGISLESLSAKSSDETFAGKALHSTEGVVAKLCELESLSVYWDSRDEPLKYESLSDFSAQMRSMIGRRDAAVAIKVDGSAAESDHRHKFILWPLSAKALLSAHTSGGSRLYAKVEVESMHVALHERQFRDAVEMAEQLILEARRAPYRELKARREPGMRGLFRYAVQTVQQDLRVHRKVMSWKWMQRMMERRRAYVEVWYKSKKAGGVTKLSQDDQMVLHMMEVKLGYSAIAEFRCLGELLFERRQPKVSEDKLEQGWLEYLLLAERGEREAFDDDVPVTGTLLVDLQRELAARTEVLRLRDTQSREGVEEIPDDLVADLVVKQTVVSLHVLEPSEKVLKDLLRVELGEVKAHVSMGTGKVAEMSIKSLKAVECISVPLRESAMVTTLLQGEEEELLQLRIGLQPPDMPAVDLIASLVLRPLDVALSAVVVARMQSFFDVRNVILDEVVEHAQDAFTNILGVLTDKIRAIATMGSRMVLNAEISAPNIIVPANAADPHGARVVLVLGKVVVQSTMAEEKEAVMRDGKQVVGLEYFYQQSFVAALTNVHLLVCRQEDWREADRVRPQNRVLDDFCVEAEAQLLTFETRTLPRVKGAARLLPVRVNVCTESVVGLLQVANSFATLGGAQDANQKAQEIPHRPQEDVSKQGLEFFDTPSPPEKAEVMPADLEGFALEGGEFDLTRNPKVVELAFEAERVEMGWFTEMHVGRESAVLQSVLLLQCTGIEMSLAQRLSDVVGTVRVGWVGLEDKVSPTATWLLQGGGERTALLEATYTGVMQRSPLHKGVEHEINAQVGEVGFCVNRETLVYVITQAVAARKEVWGDLRGVEQPEELEPEKNTQQTPPQPTSPVVMVTWDQTVGLQATVALSGVKAELRKEQKALVTFGLERTEATVALRKNGTQLAFGSLGRVEVQTPAESSGLWPRVVYVEEGARELATFRVETWKPEVGGYEGVDVSAKVHLSLLTVVCRGLFVQDMMHFAQEMQTLAAPIAGGAAQQPPPQKQQRAVAPMRLPKMALEVSIKNPHIVVPQSSESRDCLEVDLGETTVTTSAEQQGGPPRVRVKLRGIRLVARMANKEKTEMDMMRNVGVDVAVETGDKMAATMVVSPVVLFLDEEIMDLCTTILEGNLREIGHAEKWDAYVPPSGGASANDAASARAEVVVAGPVVDPNKANAEDKIGFPLEFDLLVVEFGVMVSNLALFETKNVLCTMSESGKGVFEVQAVKLTDKRAAASQFFNHIITQREEPLAQQAKGEEVAKPVLRCELDTLGSTVHVALSPLRVFVLWDSLLALYKFQDPFTSRISLAFQRLSWSQGEQSEVDDGAEAPLLVFEPEVRARAAAPAESSSTSVSVSVKGLEVYVVDDMASDTSRAMQVQLSAMMTLALKGQATDMDVEVFDLTVNRVVSMRDEILVSIVSPWKCGVSYSEVAGLLQRVEALTGPMEVVVSHGDYLLCAALYTRAMKAIDPESLGLMMSARRREKDALKVSRIVIEPPREHRETSLLYLMLVAEPLSLVGNGQQYLGLEVGEEGLEETAELKVSADAANETWLLKDGKLLVGQNPQLGVVLEDVDGRLIAMRTKRSKMANWNYTAEDGRLRLSAKPELALTVVGERVELRQASAEEAANQVWAFGVRSEVEELQSKKEDEKQRARQEKKAVAPVLAQSCNLTMKGVKVRVVDDTLPGNVIPMISLDLQQLRAFVASWSSDLSAVVDLQLVADHFDTKLQTWEPVLRGMDEFKQKEGRWKVQCSVAQMGNVFRGNVVAKRVLCLNVTQSVTGSARRLAKILQGSNEVLFQLAEGEISKLPSFSELREGILRQDDKLWKEVAERKKLHARRKYVIVNKTGERIWWAIGSHTPRELSEHEYKAEWTPDDRELAHEVGARESLAVYFGNAEEPSLDRLPIEGERCKTMRVNRFLVTYRVKQEQSTRLLELASNVQFVNEMDSSEVQVEADGVQLHLLAPHSSYDVPLRFEGGSFTFGRRTSMSFDKKAEPLNVGWLEDKAKKQRDGSLQYCRRVAGSLPGHVFCVMATGTPDMICEKFYGWKLAVVAPLRVKNLMNCDAFVRLRDGSLKVLADNLLIKPGETLEVLIECKTIALRYADFDWSAAVSVRAVGTFRFPNGSNVSVVNESDEDLKTAKREEQPPQLLTLFSPYWLLNKSVHRLTLAERPKLEALNPEALAVYSGSKVHVGIVGEKGTASVKLSAAVAAGNISIGHKEFGVSAFPGPGEFYRTQIVQFDERYHLVNMCDRTLCVAQVHTEQEVILRPREQIWYQFADPALPKHLHVKIYEPQWMWSGEFRLEDLSLFEVVMYKFTGVRAHLTVQSSSQAPTTGLVFRPSVPDFAVYRVVNSTRAAFVVRQAGQDGDPGEWLNPRDNVPFAWHKLVEQNPKVEIEFPYSQLRDAEGQLLTDEASNLPQFSMDTVDTHKGLVCQFDDAEVPLEVRVYFSGASKVMEIVEIVDVRGGLRYEDGSASKDEEEKEVNDVTMMMTLQLLGVSISLMNAQPREVMMMQLDNIRALYEDGTKEVHFGLDIDRMQIDNMLYEPLYPIVFWPKESPNSAFFHVSVNMAKGHEGILFFNGVEVVMQEAEIRVDECFATHAAAAVISLLASDEVDVVDLSSLGKPLPDYRGTVVKQEEMVYARVLYVGPLSVLFSYSSCPFGKAKLSIAEAVQIEKYLGYLNEINSVRVNLGMLNLDDAYHSLPALIQVLVEFYEWQIVRSFFSLLGAVPVIGAPGEIFKGVSRGVKGTFFSPAEGTTRSADDFSSSASRRASALLSGTVGTFFREVGKATTTASTLAANLTLDEVYKEQRQRLAKHKAQNVGQGILFAGRDLGLGFFQGFAGLVTNPVQGARRSGPGGFGVGVGTGLLGLVTKPVVGILDATSQFSEGIQNTGRAKDKRIRRPRAFDQTHAVRIYDEHMAAAFEVLREVDRSLFARSVPLFMYPGVGNIAVDEAKRAEQRDHHVLVSSKAVFWLQGTEVEKMKVKWRLPLCDLHSVVARYDGVVVVSKDGSGFLLKLETMPEVVLVHRKLRRVINGETERALDNRDAFAPAMVGPSTVRLITKLEDRKVEAKVSHPELPAVELPPEPAPVHERAKGESDKAVKSDKGKEEADELAGTV